MGEPLYEDPPLTVRELIRKLLEDEALDLDSHVHVWEQSGDADLLVCGASGHRSGKGVWLDVVLNRDGRDAAPHTRVAGQVRRDILSRQAGTGDTVRLPADWRVQMRDTLLGCVGDLDELAQARRDVLGLIESWLAG